MGLGSRHQLPVRIVQRMFDPLIAIVALRVFALVYGFPFDTEYMVLATVAALLVVTTFGATKVYEPQRSAPLGSDAHPILVAWIVIAGVLLALGYATKTSSLFSRRVLLTWMIATPVVLIGFHIALRLWVRRLREKGRNARTFVIVGGGDLARRLYDQIASSPWLGIRAEGYFDDRTPPRVGRSLPIPRLGSIDDLAAYVETRSPTFVYIALPMQAQPAIRKVIDALADTAASVYLVPDIFTFQLLNARTEHIDGMPVIGLRETPFAGAEGWLKRAEDLVLASAILIFISPLLALIAVGVKISSPGPVIFKQRRYGLDGQPFRVYKFRTMKVCEEGDVARQASRDDPRVTRFGSFLRRTSLDELPQFVNVLQGRMSIVGPRPHPIALNEQFRKQIKGYMLRHKVRPGITGLAQVNGYRGETDTLEKMQTRVNYDLNYIQSWSLQLDLKIIGQTIVNGFRQDNAF